MLALDCQHFTQTRIATIDSYPVLFILFSWCSCSASCSATLCACR